MNEKLNCTTGFAQIERNDTSICIKAKKWEKRFNSRVDIKCAPEWLI